MANSSINASLNLIDLDFDTQKQDLINFLKSQELFKDYDYTGANLNVLLDLLVYNMLKDAFYYNMTVTEGYIGAAQIKTSLTSISKALNYTPRSYKSARANVTVNFTADGTNQPYIIQKGQSFSTLVKNNSYMFSIPETIVVSSVDNNYSFTTDIYEGTYKRDSFIYQPNNRYQRFRLSNQNVDVESITVTVKEDNKLVGDAYTYKSTLLDLNYASKVYFLQCSEDGYYEILFGDGVLGYAPKDNSTIEIDYRISSGSVPNGSQSFMLNFDPTGQFNELTSPYTVITNEIASGGDVAESNESIRFNAPRHFQRQERCVVPPDYESALQEEFPEINAVAAIGGQDMDPPQFGFVFIAVDIKDVDGFPDSKKQQYFNFIRKQSALTPVFIDPDFTYFDVETVVRYNVNVTTSSPNTIKTLVINQIANYNLYNLNDFGVILRGQPFETFISQADPSIISNVTTTRVYKKLNPTLSTPQTFVLNFGMALLDNSPPEALKYTSQDIHTITSDVFKYRGVNCVLNDDSDGNIRLVQLNDSNFTTLFNIGTIDYESGIATINNLQVDSYNGNGLKIFATPADRDIQIPKLTIGQIELNQIGVTVQALQE
jgi:hypothetical protein